MNNSLTHNWGGGGDARYFLDWYEKNKRDLPWRKTQDPYKIWISEVMLQQTQVSRVIGFYENFLEKFSTVDVLAKARWPQVLSVVNGMGYYRRFRNMRETAKILMKNWNGEFPADYAALRKLPGVGDYTANALLAFAFGYDVPVIDTNVKKVLKHFFPRARNLKQLAISLCPKGKARDFFQTLMDFANSGLFVPGHERDGKNSRRQKTVRADIIRATAGIIRI